MSAGAGMSVEANTLHQRETTVRMNFWDSKWDLDVAQCPCDIHFNDWVDAEKLTGKTIYHFGTGTHHVIGIRQATNGSNNVVFGITASPGEYNTYIQLVTERPQIAKSYLCYFGDIYLTNPRLLPAFDIVALFHLGEFIDQSTTSPEYGGLSDLGVTRALLENTRPGGNVLIYSESFAHDRAEAVAAELEAAKEIAFVGKFEKLLVYRKL
jgi:hypothetical protein